MTILQKILKRVLEKNRKLLFKISIFFIFKKKIACFDIDNTLANTWPAHLLPYKNDKTKYQSLAVFINMRNYIINKSKNHTIIFLSSRNHNLYFITYHWLKDIGLPVNIFTLILVNSPSEKIYYLKQLNSNKENVLYVDDMSGNHEKNDIMFYTNEINAIKKLQNVKYLGFEEIEKINNYGDI